MTLITIQHYQCDQCGKVAVAPVRGWWTLSPVLVPRLPDRPPGTTFEPIVPDRHFCSDLCLATWASFNVNEP
jgi:hypothetical protein